MTDRDEEERVIPAEVEHRIDAALFGLQIEVAKLAIFLPDLPDRHKRLIDGTLELIDAWERG